MSGRRWITRTLWTLAGLGVVAATAVVTHVGFGGSGRPAAVVASPDPFGSTPVQRETLVEEASVSAQLGFGAASPVASVTTGVLTWLPGTGDVVRRGEAVLRADEKPVLLMYGPLPMYRRLVKDLKGADVRQFEENLYGLGYRGFTVDEEFTDLTVAAVKRWQKDLGLAETGAVETTAVIYAPGALRVAGGTARIGGTAAGDLLSCTGVTKVVTAAAEAADRAWAVRGAKVTVELPDGGDVAATVSSVGGDVTVPADGAAAQPGAGAEATVPVLLRIKDQEKLEAFDSAPVQVRYVVRERKDVLTVPVAALLALAEGGYGVQPAGAGGARTLAVEVGLVAGGRAEVTGAGLAEGLPVVIPQ
ncbi:peptidoglycan-binding domain-containing protein [Actinoplanes couchii]|uniref:Peptidoglycan-binding protein n=1 Tax=Actinoplanes couchii TaxID=403638 RepID=A0ABQ3XPS6_9ACTN|nr:peptidoglycan-binding domain-containing protein [Actinoplanes couchii]MDR6319063.1 peptidoglycan hydrolase-like protein with peptidoglycan-binding domain [Actinoplanes couchii]GID60405.1 peptidoglycan-binding protein [Actinoplanes couchii]